MDARRISVSSGRKELSVSAKILRRISSCGRTSKANGVNQIAVVDILLALTLIGSSKSIHDILFDIKKEEDEPTPSPATAALVAGPLPHDDNNVTQQTTQAGSLAETAVYLLFGSILFFQAVQLLLGFVLLRGSVKRYRMHCKIWFIGQILLLILGACLFPFFATVIPAKVATWYCSLIFLASCLYKIYCIYVVKSFMVELTRKEMRKASHSGPPLIPVATNHDEEQASPLDDN